MTFKCRTNILHLPWQSS